MSCKQTLDIVLTENTNKYEIKTLFLTVIKKCLKDVMINGVKGVVSVQPVSENVISFMNSKRHPSYPLLDSQFDYAVQYLGIPHTKVTELVRHRCRCC